MVISFAFPEFWNLNKGRHHRLNLWKKHMETIALLIHNTKKEKGAQFFYLV